jgi:hypothetical protein
MGATSSLTTVDAGWFDVLALALAGVREVAEQQHLQS